MSNDNIEFGSNQASCNSCGLKKLLRGSVRLLQAELGLDAADEATITKRRELCLNCDQYDFGVCQDCGCFLAAKVKLKSEQCPQDKW
jgi:hypothetical protein